jgi:hypothetical protein
MDYTGLPSPFALQPIPDEFAILISQIVVTWGRFETALGALIAAFVKSGTITPSGDWQRFRFEQRVSMVLDAVRVKFDSDAISGHFSRLLTSAKEIQIKRNALLHGRCLHRVRAVFLSQGVYRTELSIHAIGRHKKQDVEFHFDYAALDALFCELARICGEVEIDEAKAARIPVASSHDITALQSFLRANHRPFPMPPAP